MKLFNTIQELWDYCKYCPICTRNCREVIVSVGPDFSFILISHSKNDTNLVLQCTYKRKGDIYNVDYQINCIDNTFHITEPKVVQLANDIAKPEKVKEAYFYFFIEGLCNECNGSSANSQDLEFDLEDGTISNMGLERENFYLFETEEKFHITPIHDRNVMLVSRLYQNGEVGFSESKTIELPIVKLDLSDQAKTVNKLKTLILFS